MDVETDIELSAMFSSSSNPTITESIKAALTNRLGPEYLSDVASLGHTMALFLLTVYEVESRRARQLSTIKGVFSYFYAFRDTTNGFFSVMMGILKTIFDDFVEQLKAQERSEWTESILEDHMEFLLVQLCHRYVILQDLALRYICLLLESFPFLKTNAYCLNVLMKCLLTIKINLGPIEGMPVTLDTKELRVLKNDSPLHYILMLPLRSDELNDLYAKVKQVLSIWMQCENTGFEEEILITIQKCAHRVRLHT